MDSTSLFQVVIESVEPDESFIQNFWVHGDHIGEAIETVLSACSELEIQNAIASEADCVNSGVLPDGVTHDKELDVFYQGRIYFPTEELFIAPFGIIKSGQNGELDYELIREGFSPTKRDDDEIYQIDAVVQRDKLFDTFIELVKRLPSIRVFWIRFAPDWEDQNREEFWTNETLNSVELIEGYLKSHWNDTVTNGYVALTAYSTVGQTNLSIDTHKIIKVLGKSANIQSEMVAALRKSGYQELPAFYSLESGYYHWHYRATRSKSRTELIGALKEDGFTLWREEVVQPDN